jgi:hypothetical protein
MADPNSLPPLPPGFTLDTPGIGRPVIRKGPEPVKPQSREMRGNYVVDLNGDKPTAKPISGLPADKWERATPADLKPLGVSGPYLINRATGDIKLVDVPKTDPTKAPDIGAVRATIANVIDKALEAREKSRNGWFATGFGADIANKVGGTTAADVKSLIDTISANTAFETLQKMRESSPTGGALGAISERELDLLRSTIASPEQSQSDDQFQKSMWDIAQSYGRVLAKIPGGRAIMIQRGWVPKASTPKPKPKAESGAKFLGFE